MFVFGFVLQFYFSPSLKTHFELFLIIFGLRLMDAGTCSLFVA